MTPSTEPTGSGTAAATIIDGRAMADELREDLANKIAASGNRPPGLATLLVGDVYTAMAYERRLGRLAEDLGCHYANQHLPADSELAEVLATIGRLNADPRISGIIVLRPLLGFSLLACVGPPP